VSAVRAVEHQAHQGAGPLRFRQGSRLRAESGRPPAARPVRQPVLAGA
jgi:hypothetical protein